MNGHSRSILFMMEQLVVILVFAVCSVVCVSIFVESYLMEQRTLETKNAILTAGSGAESYKASGGRAGDAIAALGGIAGAVYSGDPAVFYDDKWNPCAEDQAVYVLRIIRLYEGDSLLLPAEITVGRIDGDELFTLPVTVSNAQRTPGGGAGE